MTGQGFGVSTRGGEKGPGFKCGDVFGGLRDKGVVGAADRLPPRLNISTVAATSRLLCDEEAHVVVGMVGGLEAA